MSGIGIITALRAEAACLTRQKPRPNVIQAVNEQLSLVLSGMGADCTTAAVQQLLAAGVRGLVSFGTAGALDAGLRPGDIIIPDKVSDTRGGSHELDPLWRAHAIQCWRDSPSPIHHGDIVTSDTVIADPAAKQALQSKSGAVAVDMESAVVAELAGRQGLPVLCIRVIVDAADRAIPASVLDLSDAYGDVALPALLAQVLRRPPLLRELLRLGRAFGAARRSMQWLGRHPAGLLLPP